MEELNLEIENKSIAYGDHIWGKTKIQAKDPNIGIVPDDSIPTIPTIPDAQ